jgi:hypothetical protein
VSLFPNAFHVARREYLFRVRGRAFIITTVLLGVAVAAITLVPTILGALGVDEPPEVAVLVEADGLRTDPVVAIGALLSAGTDPDEPAIGPPGHASRRRGGGRAGGAGRRVQRAAQDRARHPRRARLRVPDR